MMDFSDPHLYEPNDLFMGLEVEFWSGYFPNTLSWYDYRLLGLP